MPTSHRKTDGNRAPAPAFGLDIAVIDDEPSVRRAMDRLLRSNGFGVVTFESAEQFLALCHPKGLACLVLDLKLGGMSGLELQARLAEAGTPVPTIVISAHGDAKARAAAARHGSLAFLQKPFTEEELIGAVQRAVADRD